MSTPSERELRDYERTSQWFTPLRKKPSVYEDVTIDVAEHVDRHWKFGYQIGFADGRLHYWDSSKVKSSSWWDFRDPAEIWARPFYQIAALHDREIRTVLEVAKADRLYDKFGHQWLEFLRDHLQAIALAEYGLVMPMANAVRPSLGDPVLNCISFHGGYKLRHAQALALYGMELEARFGDFPTERGKASFMSDGAWQPTRRYLERLDLVHDWVEIIVAANVVFEPLIGVLLRRELLMYGASVSDDLVTSVYGQVAQAEWEWGRAWTTAFMAHLVEDPQHGEANRAVIAQWLEDWLPLGEKALDALGGLFEQVPGRDFADAHDGVQQELAAVMRESKLATVEVEA